MHNYCASQLSNPNANINTENQELINRVLNIDLSNYNSTASSTLESDGLSDRTNSTGSNQKDNALELFYAQSQGDKLMNWAKDIFTLPEFILVDLLGIPKTPITWIINLLNWFWNIGIIVAVYYFIRGIK